MIQEIDFAEIGSQHFSIGFTKPLLDYYFTYWVQSVYLRYENASFISLDKFCSKIARPIFHDSPKIWPIFQFTMWYALQLLYYIAEFSTIILFVEKHSKFGAILKTS